MDVDPAFSRGGADGVHRLSFLLKAPPARGQDADTDHAGRVVLCDGLCVRGLERSLGEVKLSLQIEYVGIPFVSALWLYQIIQFTGTAAAYRKRLALALFVVPASVFLVQLTNDWHHLMYERLSR